MKINRLFVLIISLLLVICLVPVFAAKSSKPSKSSKSGNPPKTSKPKAQKTATVIAPQSNLQQVAGVIHLQTTISGGKRTIADYVDLARQRNMGIVCITDRDNQRYQYGVWPFRWLIKKTEEWPSVMTFGPGNYLSAISRANQSAQDVLVIDGTEVTAYYYWTGSYLGNNLVLNNRERHLLVLGLNQAGYYQNLPTVANGKSRFSPYDGIQTYEPYQDLIDYVSRQGGLTFWAHPEANEYREIEGIKVQSNPYPEALAATKNYTGFAVLGEGYQKAGIPGGIWDRVLMEFCAGKRRQPGWAIGELDDMGNKELDGVQTVFLLKSKSYQGAIDALRTGKCYVVTKAKTAPALTLNDFWMMDNNQVAYSGELLTVNPKSQKPTIYIRVASAGQSPAPVRGGSPPKSKDKKAKLVQQAGAIKAMVTVKIISNGRLVQEYNQPLPLEARFTPDISGLKPGQMTYYRLDIIDSNQGHLISNPIFIKAE